MATSTGQPVGPAVRPTRGRVVVALDGSAAAEAVLSFVVAFARHTGAKITLVHACPPADDLDAAAGFALIGRLSAGDEASPRPRSARQEAEHYLEQVVQRLASEGLAADYEILEGPPGEAIVDEAEGLAAEMVAMTTHGRTGLGKLLLGSVASYVVGHATCPVLLTRVT